MCVCVCVCQISKFKDYINQMTTLFKVCVYQGDGGTFVIIIFSSGTKL